MLRPAVAEHAWIETLLGLASINVQLFKSDVILKNEYLVAEVTVVANQRISILMYTYHIYTNMYVVVYVYCLAEFAWWCMSFVDENIFYYNR